MFRPIALYIGLRYTRAKRANHFISFISLSSMLGIALGVTVLITVLSVMNGFDQQIRERVMAMAPQVTVSTLSQKMPDWKTMQQNVLKDPQVIDAEPFVSGQGLLQNAGISQPVVMNGVSPSQQSRLTDISHKMVQGSFDALRPGRFGIVLGYDLALNLGLRVGDKVLLMIPQASVTPVGVLPRLRRFDVVGIFHVGKGFGFDDHLAFINLKDAQVLYQLGSAVSGLRLKVSNFYAAPRIASRLASNLPEGYIVGNWTQTFGALFHAIQLEKTMMFLILMLIIAVAAFNLVSSLVMTVADKRADIAILRTFGATPRTILAIFMVQGTIVGFVGTFLGVLGGIVLSLNATRLVNWIQSVFHVQLLSSNIYFVDYLPSRLQGSDVWHICLAALVMSLLATIYPAWRASRTQPAQALRYE